MPINQPMNQIKLTNVTLVRMRKGGKRFEIACYKNKIQDYRNKIETDLDNVVQIKSVYINVSKGEKASKADFAKIWEGWPEEKIVKHILENGEFQIGEKERVAELERIKNEVVNIVSSRLVGPTKRVYTTGMIEKALDQLSSQTAASTTGKSNNTAEENGEEREKALPKWRGVVANKDAKSQANHAIKCMIAHQPIPVSRIQMRLRITCTTSIIKQTVKLPASGSSANAGATSINIKDALLNFLEKVEGQEIAGSEWEAVGLVEPGSYKPLNEFIENHTKGRGNVDVLDPSVGVDV